MEKYVSFSQSLTETEVENVLIFSKWEGREGGGSLRNGFCLKKHIFQKFSFLQIYIYVKFIKCLDKSD